MKWGGTLEGIRNEPLTKEEKAELTLLLRKLRVLPHNGQVILHCNNGRVAKIEPRWEM